MTSSASATQGYFAFISYSHRDKPWADWLHKALETYRVPRRLVGQITGMGPIPPRLVPIFRDRDELPSASDLDRKVDESLARSANLIVICSPHAAASRWVNAEVLAYKRLGRAARIFCLIVGGEPRASSVSGREANECFAPALRYTLDAEGQLTQVRTELIAADARPGRDGRANAKLKLIAGLLDVGFDTLKQRELQRRYRRMAALTGLSAAVMVATGILAIAAVIARHDAERRQKQAENLVDFMLGDLNDKLGEMQRLDIMQAVDDKAMAYFAALPSKDVTDAALTQRVVALEKIGSVRMEQAQLPLALDSYRAAAALARELLQRAPRDSARQAAYADSLKWVGQAYWFNGDLGHASSNFEQASALLERTLATSPDNEHFAESLAYVANDVGHVLEARGDLEAANRQYQRMRELYQRLVRGEPENATWQAGLGDAYNDLGKLALEQGRLAESVADYRIDQRIKASLASHSPQNRDAQERLLASNAILGRTLALGGEIESAERYTSAAVESARALVRFDPTLLSWQEYLALYSQQLGGLLRQQGRLDAAQMADAEALRGFAALLAKNRSQSDWQRELAQSQLEAARLAMRRGQAAGAEALADEATHTLAALHAAYPENFGLMLLTAQAYTVLGQIALMRGDVRAARALWSRASDVIAPALTAGRDPNLLAAQASALLLRDELPAAKAPLSELAAMGYRTPDFESLVASKGLIYSANDAVRQSIAAAH